MIRTTIENLTDEEARAVLDAASFKVAEMTATYGAYGLDDRGDYLAAAIDNYHRLFHAYWDNDGDSKAFVTEVKNFLSEPVNEWGGSDGEIRFAVLEFVSPDDDTPTGGVIL
jgi:hypothetical protein